jgi:uncharacterized membrane protein
MALGYPTVGTSVAMEGIEDFLPGVALGIPDSEQEFAARIVAVLLDPLPALAEAQAMAVQLKEQLSFPRAMAALSVEFSALLESTH